jgi:6-pyruvoyltetrahydropterin/6-carboxytetrahydropterin synthase
VFRLTREVRFALTDAAPSNPANGHGGSPALDRIAPWLTLRVSLAGELDPRSSYLRNIKQIDEVVRARAVPLLNKIHCDPTAAGQLGMVPAAVGQELNAGWPGVSVDAIEMQLSPYLSLGVLMKELPMTRLSQKFEFSAAHRLHNPALSESENINTYGKCNNPHGHGHNYELQVTVSGTPGPSGVVMAVETLERIVHEHVIQVLDHKHLNVEVAEFSSLIPSVENISKVIYSRLKLPIAHAGAKLASVTVWETPKTWCEYSE